MTKKEKNNIIEAIQNIRMRLDKYVGRERHLFLIACRANIRLSRLFKSRHQFALIPEYEEYCQFVDEQLGKSALTLPPVTAPVQEIIF